MRLFKVVMLALFIGALVRNYQLPCSREPSFPRELKEQGLR
ncbi:MAG TPA: hypothetical protein VI260_01300 [Blastocatellia bacterium]|jgi:hypothetical protein